MAINGNSLSERITRWQVLAQNLRESEGLDHVAPDLQQLEERMAEARNVQNLLEDLRSQLRAQAARVRKLAIEGDSIRARIGASLRSKHGFTSEALIKYGLKPRRVPRRRPKTPAAVVTGPAPAVKTQAADD